MQRWGHEEEVESLRIGPRQGTDYRYSPLRTHRKPVVDGILRHGHAGAKYSCAGSGQGGIAIATWCCRIRWRELSGYLQKNEWVHTALLHLRTMERSFIIAPLTSDGSTARLTIARGVPTTRSTTLCNLCVSLPLSPMLFLIDSAKRPRS